jgi:hypothetical protein
MVRDGKCSFRDMIKTAENNIIQENYDTLIKMIYQWISRGSDTYVPRKYRKEV